MIPVDSRTAYNVFNIEIITDKCKIICSEHGKYIEYYYKIPEPTYGNYNTLSAFSQERYKTELTTALSNVINEAVKYIKDGNLKIKCTSEDALKVHEILESLNI